MISKGRYRRQTPDRQYQSKMREALKEWLDEMPAHITRGEVEALGTDIGLDDPAEEATKLFGRLKGVSWRGGIRNLTGTVVGPRPG